MAAPFPGQVSQFQIGSYFASNYYQMLQTRPELVHQFYNNASTLVRLDIATMETANAHGMLQIHNLIMSLNISTIEIKTLHCLESWSGGILLTVSGLVQMRDWSYHRRFIQTFFLAPQEKGYYVLNDMFHVLDQEQGPQFVGSLPVFMHNGFGGQVPTSNPEPEESEVQSKEIVAGPPQEGETVDKYSIHEPPVESLQPEPEPVVDDADMQEPTIPPISVQVVTEMEPEQPQPSPAPAAEPEPEPEPEPETVVETLSTSDPSQTPSPSQNNVMEAPVPEPEPVPVTARSREVEPVVLGEQPKLSYASVLRAKGQSQYTQIPHYKAAPSDKTSLRPTTTEAKPVVQPHLSNAAPLLENPVSEPLQQPIAEDEGEVLSIYVRNLPPSTQIADMEQVFKAFGRLRPNGIAIRSRKETGMVFAFIDFEEASSVENAITASPIQFKGRSIYVEGKKSNISTSHGPRRAGGGGTSAFPSEHSRGRYTGGGMGRSSNDRDYGNRPGSMRRGSSRGGFSDQVSRNGPAS